MPVAQDVSFAALDNQEDGQHRASPAGQAHAGRWASLHT